MRTRAFSRDDLDTIVALYREGRGLATLARQFDCSPRVIRTTLVAEGVAIRAPGRPRRDSDDVLIAAYREHGSVRQAAMATGYSDAGLAYRLDLANEIPQPRTAGPASDPRAVLDRAVAEGAPAECWEARGPRTHDGYVMLRQGRRTKTAHRLAWEVDRQREVPDGRLVMHLCDNPACANPGHLQIGTHRQNSRQMQVRDRGGQAKLLVADIREIRQRAAAGDGVAKIANDYPVGTQQIRRIVENRAWRDI